MWKAAATALVLLLLSRSLPAAVYEVGSGKTHVAIGDVPWESLNAGDIVRIHWRAQPYNEKWVICREGTQAQPIIVRGVPGPNGELPVIDGRNATTRRSLNFWNENRGVIKIGGANTPDDTMPTYITIENLDIRSARPPYTYTNFRGAPNQPYAENASAIYVEKCAHLILRNCAFRDSGNGLMIAHQTSDALIEGCRIYDNGIEGSIYEHNNYTAAAGITFQYNWFGPLRANCPGNNLKDRSAGLVVRCNWIEGGNRQLDLVDAEDSADLVNDPRYHKTFVYGNVLIEPDGAGNSQIVHYGGDSGTESDYRKGTLYFYNNTIVSTRAGNTTLFRLSTNGEHCDCRNNIVFVTAAGNRFAMLAEAGRLDLRRNHFRPGRVASHDGDFAGTINDNRTSIEGAAPGFVDFAGQDYHLKADSPCIDAAIALHADVLPANDVLRQYIRHQSSEPRPRLDAPDLGAYEFEPPRTAVTIPWDLLSRSVSLK